MLDVDNKIVDSKEVEKLEEKYINYIKGIFRANERRLIRYGKNFPRGVTIAYGMREGFTQVVLGNQKLETPYQDIGEALASIWALRDGGIYINGVRYPLKMTLGDFIGNFGRIMETFVIGREVKGDNYVYGLWEVFNDGQGRKVALEFHLGKQDYAFRLRRMEFEIKGSYYLPKNIKEGVIYA